MLNGLRRSARLPEIRRDLHKLDAIDDCVIIGCAGPAGLGQRYKGRLSEVLKWTKNGHRIMDLPIHRVMGCLHEAFLDQTQEQLKSLAAAKNVIEAREGLAGTLLAIPLTNGLTLLTFSDICTPEHATPELPFTAVGSGQAIADPFLAFLKRVLWKDEQPSLSVGVFSVIWTLKHAIETNPGGIGAPLHVGTLTLEDGAPKIRWLLQDQIDDHFKQIDDVERQMGEAARGVGTTASTPPPMPAS